MDDKTYVQNAIKTAASPDGFKHRFNETRMDRLKGVTEQFVLFAGDLDGIKKTHVYGKNNIDQLESGRMGSSLTNEQGNLIHGLLGIMTEAGELGEILIKGVEKVDKVNLQEEIGDIMWYIALICNTYGFDLGEIKKRNIDKLAARYPNLFTEQDALNRNLDTERKILES